MGAFFSVDGEQQLRRQIEEIKESFATLSRTFEDGDYKLIGVLLVNSLETVDALVDSGNNYYILAQITIEDRTVESSRRRREPDAAQASLLTRTAEHHVLRSLHDTAQVRLDERTKALSAALASLVIRTDERDLVRGELKAAKGSLVARTEERDAAWASLTDRTEERDRMIKARDTALATSDQDCRTLFK
jgi:hypothetical protein